MRGAVMDVLGHWLTSPAQYARAAWRIYDTDGAYARRGDVGAVCDIDNVDGYVIVDFPATGPMLCDPNEISPA